ncbi:hypothetical protein TCAL_14951 [Tigriopus californicus]|uniref:Uncharacterized protein n=1 Tax=Tigriopus californicus TaxID=6832 RepID=A0A553N8N4_TIGCA|nr:uncharacterized protein LOC131884770 [Tigriopus californicus]TRY61798.1 hypothetical protein TCAL_14951 [Tigriopus californicus]
MASTENIDINYLREFLHEHSIRSKYYVEYLGFRSNHLCHAAVALYELKASKEYFHSYLNHYQKRLEAKENSPTHHSQKDADLDSLGVPELLGRRKNYYQILEHFDSLTTGSDPLSWEELVKREFTELALGIAGSAFHPLIHIGYGIAIEDSPSICEGLAYLHHSYLPISESLGPSVETFGQGDRSFPTILTDVRQDMCLNNWLKETKNSVEFAEPGVGQFQQALIQLFKHKSQEVLGYAEHLQLPGDLPPATLMTWVLEQILIVYTGSTPRNDFFLLHGITSCWALRNIVPLLTPSKLKQILRYYVVALISTYLACGCPTINMDLVEKVPDVEHTEWKDIKKKMFQIPVEQLDEHILKVVHICNELKSSVAADASVFKRACLCSMDFPLSFNGP